MSAPACRSARLPNAPTRSSSDGVHNMNFEPKRLRGGLHFGRIGLVPRIVGVNKDAERAGGGHQLTHESNLLLKQFGSEERDASDVAAGAAEIADEAQFDRSPPMLNTIGIVVVTALAAGAERPPSAAMTATWRWTRSAASNGTRLACPVVRTSNCTLRPST